MGHKRFKTLLEIILFLELAQDKLKLFTFWDFSVMLKKTMTQENFEECLWSTDSILLCVST